MPIPGKRVRVLGSGYTVFAWQGKVIGFADTVSVRSVQPVAAAVPIQPMNAKRPVEIVTPGAHTNGTITLTLTELYNQTIWHDLATIARSQNIIDIMTTLAADNNGIQIIKYVQPPAGIGQGPYSETFFNCIVASVTDDEDIRVDTLQVNKTMEIWYTHSVKQGYKDVQASNEADPIVSSPFN